MTKPVPEQEVFDYQVFQSAENIFECRDRIEKQNADKGGFGSLQSQDIRGQSQRLFQNMSPTLKGSSKWVPELGLSTGNLSPTSIKVIKN